MEVYSPRYWLSIGNSVKCPPNARETGDVRACVGFEDRYFCRDKGPALNIFAPELSGTDSFLVKF